MKRAIFIAALALAACGTEAPCQSPGTYCDANTLCVNGQATECVEATGGTCQNHPDPVCLPPRPPPPERRAP